MGCLSFLRQRGGTTPAPPALTAAAAAAAAAAASGSRATIEDIHGDREAEKDLQREVVVLDSGSLGKASKL